MTERKTLVKIDEDLLAEAREILGTSSIVETVNQALKEVVALAARRRVLRQERLMSEGVTDQAAERRQAWG